MGKSETRIVPEPTPPVHMAHPLGRGLGYSDKFLETELSLDVTFGESLDFGGFVAEVAFGRKGRDAERGWAR